jgi:hypothetical protein
LVVAVNAGLSFRADCWARGLCCVDRRSGIRTDRNEKSWEN